MDNVGAPRGLHVKKESAEEDFKQYAETAMNELLGWYGYGGATKEDMMVKTTVNSHSNSNSNNSSGPSSPSQSAEGCGWCSKIVEEKTGISVGALSFCSELCFSQSRRANFKKNKTCDWCRHVRHTVSYVDFQDGASQLQFCSDKCLNQYKMHIFCRETRAHLEMHPHLPNVDNGSGLITPDLWLKNCKSPDRVSISPPPTSPKSVSAFNLNPREFLPQTSKLPLITVAHPSKLLAPSTLEENNKRKRTPVQRKRKRPDFPKTTSIDLPQDLRIRQSPPLSFENQNSKDNLSQTFQNDIRVPPQFNNNNNNNPIDENQSLPSNAQKQINQNIVPPVTILVPYPIIIPVPLPIPIPLPIQSFLDAEKTRNKINNDLKDLKDISSHNEDNKANNLSNDDKTDENDVVDVVNGTEDIISEVNSDKVEIESLPLDNSNLVKDDVKDDLNNGISRPLRKRKRILDGGNKIILKNSKKSVPT